MVEGRQLLSRICDSQKCWKGFVLILFAISLATSATTPYAGCHPFYVEYFSSILEEKAEQTLGPEAAIRNVNLSPSQKTSKKPAPSESITFLFA